QALDIARRHDMKTGQAIAKNNIGNVYLALGNYKGSYESHKEALNIAKETKDLSNIASGLNQLGGDEMRMGYFEESIKSLEESLAITRRLGEKYGEAVVLHNLGHAYELLGFFNRGLELLNESAAIKKTIGDVSGRAESLSVIGAIYLQLGDYAKALEFFKKARDMQSKIGAPFHGQDELIARSYIEIGDMENAEKTLFLVHNSILSGVLALRKANFPLALNRFRGQLEKSTQSNDVIGLFESNSGLGLTYEAIGDLDKAQHHFKEAILQVDRIRDGLPEALRSNFYNTSVWYYKRIVPFEGMARILMKSGNQSASLQFAESCKARYFSEALSFSGKTVRYNVPSQILQRDKDMNLNLAGAQKCYEEALKTGDANKCELAESSLKKKKADLSQHIAELRVNYPIFAATKYPQPMETSQLALKDGEWALEYQVTNSGFCVYLLNGTKIIYSSFRPIPRNELLSLVHKFRSKLEVKNNDTELMEKLRSFDFQTGNRLATVLLGEVLESLPKNVPLILVPDDVLGALPFETLPLTSEGKIGGSGQNIAVTGASFFGDRNQIVYAQSLTALSLSRTLGKKISNQDKTLIFADPVFQLNDKRVQNIDVKRVVTSDKYFMEEITRTMSTVEDMGGNLTRLQRTGELAESLKSILKDRVDMYTGIKATKHNLLEELGPKLANYSNIVFATHGDLGANIPGVKEPCLILTLVPPGTDGFLRMSEVMSMDLNSNMVVLTACQTGIGKNVSGEGAMCLGRAFQYAGAKTVLMSLWNVSEEASVMLTQSMFKHMKNGQSKLNALKMAREDIRKRGFDHPFFWAGFVLAGDLN
ncbi:MAG: CHAT domain-containing protein, partial [Desulfomonilaceae bacterium]